MYESTENSSRLDYDSHRINEFWVGILIIEKGFLAFFENKNTLNDKHSKSKNSRVGSVNLIWHKFSFLLRLMILNVIFNNLFCMHFWFLLWINRRSQWWWCSLFSISMVNSIIYLNETKTNGYWRFIWWIQEGIAKMK